MRPVFRRGAFFSETTVTAYEFLNEGVPDCVALCYNNAVVAPAQQIML